jgi:hypothetical protein
MQKVFRTSNQFRHGNVEQAGSFSVHWIALAQCRIRGRASFVDDEADQSSVFIEVGTRFSHIRLAMHIGFGPAC